MSVTVTVKSKGYRTCCNRAMALFPDSILYRKLYAFSENPSGVSQTAHAVKGRHDSALFRRSPGSRSDTPLRCVSGVSCLPADFMYALLHSSNHASCSELSSTSGGKSFSSFGFRTTVSLWKSFTAVSVQRPFMKSVPASFQTRVRE